MIRAVIDTNVLVSGLLSAAGNEALILQAVHQDRVRPCITEEILAEYVEVLARPKFSFPSDQIAALIDMFRRKGELTAAKEAPIASPDAGDTKFLSCAHAAQADFLVTGNQRHFPDAPYGRTRVVSAGQMLGEVTLET